MTMGAIPPLLDNPKKIDETRKVTPLTLPINGEGEGGRILGVRRGIF